MSKDQNFLTLTPFAADTPVSPSATPEDERENQTRGIFGQSSRDCFASLETVEGDPDTLFWRTSQDTFQWASGQYSETWPDSGTMRNGSVFEHQTLEQVTFESESSLWPTTRASSGGGNRSGYPGAPYRPALAQRTQAWDTPQAHDSTPGDPARVGRFGTKHGGRNLTDDVTTWRSPQAMSQGGPRSRTTSTDQGHQLSIEERAERWQTPHGMSNKDAKWKTGGCGGGEFGKQANQWQTPATDSFRSRGGDRVNEMGLDQQARFFPTPQAADGKMVKGGKRGPILNPSLGTFAENLHQVPATQDGPTSSESVPISRRRLNPQFVEWLMGFPIGHTLP